MEICTMCGTEFLTKENAEQVCFCETCYCHEEVPLPPVPTGKL